MSTPCWVARPLENHCSAHLTARTFYESQGLVANTYGVSEAENESDVTYCWKPDDR
jgi:hypothetical protein